MGIIALDDEILKAEIVDGADIAGDLQPWQGARGARQLRAGLFQMVQIQMRVAEGMDEIARLQPRHMRHHVREQGV